MELAEVVRKELMEFLSDPIHLPDVFKQWLPKYMEVNPPALHVAGMAGYKQQPTITTSSFAAGPPAQARDKDLWIGTSVDANGTRWAFQYNANSTSDYKWEFIGGPPSFKWSKSTAGLWTVGSWDYFAGTQWTCPRNGDWFVRGAVGILSPNAAGTNNWSAAILHDNGTGYVVTGSDSFGIANPSQPLSGVTIPAPETLLTGHKAGDKFAVGYNFAATPNTFQGAHISVLPVRVS